METLIRCMFYLNDDTHELIFFLPLEPVIVSYGRKSCDEMFWSTAKKCQVPYQNDNL